MGKTSIEWTATVHPDGTMTPGYTFNLVWGCIRISEGCRHCYAERLAKQYGHNVWGPASTTPRRMMSPGYWAQPLRWNARAAKLGQRARVFCSSMADVFEDHPTNEHERPKLWALIAETPWLDWQLLTKRPQNINRMVPMEWLRKPLRNVWYGTSVEHQRAADERLPHLLAVPAHVRFLSCEPLLGEVDLSNWMVFEGQYEKAEWMLAHYGRSQPLDWIIAGGESGPKARPAHPNWFRFLRDQCVGAGVAFLFKQHGEFVAASQLPSDLQIARHADAFDPDVDFYRVGKHAAGRLLDGQEWSQFPETVPEVAA